MLWYKMTKAKKGGWGLFGSRPGSLSDMVIGNDNIWLPAKAKRNVKVQ